MVLFGLIFLAVLVVLVGVGSAVGLVACVITAILLGLGVVSTSVLIGLRRGRPAAGIRAFLLQCGVLAGIPAGAFCAWLVQTLFSAYGGWPVLVYGALGGAVAGAIIALCLDYVWRRVHAWAWARLRAAQSDGQRAIERKI